MVKTAAKKETVDEYARVLIQHHAQVCMREGLLTEPPVPPKQGTRQVPLQGMVRNQARRLLDY